MTQTGRWKGERRGGGAKRSEDRTAGDTHAGPPCINRLLHTNLDICAPCLKDSLQGSKKGQDEQDGRQDPSRAQNDSRRNLKTAETEAASCHCQCQANVADHKTSDRARFRAESLAEGEGGGGDGPLAEAAKVRAK